MIYTHAAYKCYVFLGTKKVDREETLIRINQLGVPCFLVVVVKFILKRLNKNFQPKVRLPNAKLLGETSLMFLCHPTLKQEEVDKTCEVIKKLFG